MRKLSKRGADVLESSLAQVQDAATADSVPANACVERLLTIAGDARDDVVQVTPDTTWPNLSLSTENSAATGRVRLVVCNPTAAAIDPPSTAFHWVAIDVD